MRIMNSGSAAPSLPRNRKMVRNKPLRASTRGGFAAFALAALSSVTSVARAESAEPTPKPQVTAGAEDTRKARALLLRQHLPHAAGAAGGDRYLGAILGTVYVGLGVGVAAADFNEDPSGRQRWATIGIAGGLALVSFSSYVVPDHLRRPVLESLGGLTLAGFGASFLFNAHNTAATRFTFGSMIATGAVLQGLVILDAALQEPWNARKLETWLQRLESGESLSDAEFRRVEHDFALTVRPVPRWVFPLVMMGGGVAAAAPALASGTSHDDRQLALLFSSLMFVAAASSLAPALSGSQSGYRAYLRALKGMQLAPIGPVGSAGLTLRANF